MTISLKADPGGTFGEILVNGSQVAKFTPGGNAAIAGLVGTVSQSGGVPTGAVVERGSNANGEFVRFADGTQICTNNNFAAGAANIAVGAVFRSANQVWTYPMPFVNIPCTSAKESGGSGLSWNGLADVADNSTLAMNFCVWSSVSGSPTTQKLLAIGRWF